MICLMARKTYSQDFRRQAVALYESTPVATFKGIAADLGISRGALANWVRELGSGGPAAAGPVDEAAATAAGSGGTGRARGSGGGGADARIAALEAQVAALEADRARQDAEQRKLETERDILRQAAKYFAGETNWRAVSSSSPTTRTPSR